MFVQRILLKRKIKDSVEKIVVWMHIEIPFSLRKKNLRLENAVFKLWEQKFTEYAFLI
jgi:hypothetical protein